ncbi:hypothetical protein A3Q56_00775 [Intoshia linei]|uniref:Uncharacterized protein n=1 Tax=Intoshia linei TaxID=1819745 RepID=A0A177BB31_9BILA|nr:hypothetical protein A3Q56_00775 [Intoshia linei]
MQNAGLKNELLNLRKLLKNQLNELKKQQEILVERINDISKVDPAHKEQGLQGKIER